MEGSQKHESSKILTGFLHNNFANLSSDSQSFKLKAMKRRTKDDIKITIKKKDGTHISKLPLRGLVVPNLIHTFHVGEKSLTFISL